MEETRDDRVQLAILSTDALTTTRLDTSRLSTLLGSVLPYGHENKRSLISAVIFVLIYVAVCSCDVDNEQHAVERRPLVMAMLADEIVGVVIGRFTNELGHGSLLLRINPHKGVSVTFKEDTKDMRAKWAGFAWQLSFLFCRLWIMS